MDRLTALKLSGFLTMLANGWVPVPLGVQREAKELLDATDTELAGIISDDQPGETSRP